MEQKEVGGMKGKMKFKIILDLLMTVVLLALMAFQITGQELHEWFGAGMLVLFLMHNILNFKWYKNLFKGRYTMFRVLQAVSIWRCLFPCSALHTVEC